MKLADTIIRSFEDSNTFERICISRTKVYTLRFPNRTRKLNQDMILLIGVNRKAKGIITRPSTIFLLLQFSFEKLIFSPLFIYIFTIQHPLVQLILIQ